MNKYCAAAFFVSPLLAPRLLLPRRVLLCHLRPMLQSTCCPGMTCRANATRTAEPRGPHPLTPVRTYPALEHGPSI